MSGNKHCVNCGKEFKPKYKTLKFCCRKCSGKYTKNKARHFTKETKKKISDSVKLSFLSSLGIAPNCNTLLEIDRVLENRNSLLKLAGYIQVASGVRKPKQHTCKICGKLFYSDRATTKCCSKLCLYISNSLAGKLGGKVSATVQNKRSKNEIMLADLCKLHFDSVMCNQPIFNGWDADIILADKKVAILWNGIWHYKLISKTQSLALVQNRDTIKLREIVNCGYVPYIIKDTGKYNPKFVKLLFDKLLDFLNNGLVAQRLEQRTHLSN